MSLSSGACSLRVLDVVCCLFCSINQKMMVMIMRKLGYELVCLAADGLQALQLLEREATKGRAFEIDCILMVRTTCAHA